MKAKIFTSLLLLIILGTNLSAQETYSPEKYGKTLNIGLGVGHYGYLGHFTPAVHLNYEIDALKNFTIAPFISLISYRKVYNENGFKYYAHHTIIPIGAKGTYYFDELLKANSKWDFYLAGSLGFAIVNSSYDRGYSYNGKDYRGSNHLFLDIHAGAEYRINKKFGAFLDLSTGMSTIGIAIH